MSSYRRVVMDTSTLVSAALRRGSLPERALLKALACSDLCASPETLDELATVLRRDKFDCYLGREQRDTFVALVRRHARLFTVSESELAGVEPHCRDAQDEKFLALVLAAEADVLVSSDQDLLVLHPWRGIPIITPEEFLRDSAAR